MGLAERDSQTEYVATADSESQASSHATAEVQTDKVAPAMAEAIAQMGTNTGHDAPLAEFLRSAAPPVERQLMRNLAGDALTGYDVNWGDDESTISCIHELHFKGVNKSTTDTEPKPLPCTDVSWNSTGWVVAVAYGAVEQGAGWSDQESCIAVWNLARPLVNKNKPDHVLELPVSPPAPPQIVRRAGTGRRTIGKFKRWWWGWRGWVVVDVVVKTRAGRGWPGQQTR